MGCREPPALLARSGACIKKFSVVSEQPTDFQSALHLVRSCGIGITLVVRQLCRIALEPFEAAGIFVARCETEAVYLRGNIPIMHPKLGQDAWQMWRTATLPA